MFMFLIGECELYTNYARARVAFLAAERPRRRRWYPLKRVSRYFVRDRNMICPPGGQNAVYDNGCFHRHNLLHALRSVMKQGSDIIELWLTCREMNNWIFG